MGHKNLKIKIFADGADIVAIKKVYQAGVVSGFTTNPSLMKKAGVQDYNKFAQQVLAEITDMPISFEVFADDIQGMETEARKIHSWGKNVYIKIPIINTKGESTIPLVKKLSADGLKINVTAVFNADDAKAATEAITPGVGAVISYFAGRIADTGVNPMPVMAEISGICHKIAGVESLWASTREIFNIMQAQECNADIITVSDDILKKLSMFGKDLRELNLETVQMFYNDATALGYKII